MKTLAFLSLSLAVALGVPVFIEEDRSPLLGAWVPVQGHVVVEDPAPQARLGSKEREESASIPVEMQQSPPEVKMEPEVKADTEVKAEQEVTAEKEVKVEPVVKAEPEVKAEKEVKVEPEVKAEKEVKVEPEVKAEQEVKAEPEVKAEQEVEAENEVKVEPVVKAEQEVKAEPEVKVEQEVKAEPEVKAEQEVEAESEVNVEQKVEGDLEVNMHPDVKVEPDVQWEPEEEYFQVETEVPVDQEAEVDPGQEVEERHIDMEREYQMPDEPIMKLEPLEQASYVGEELSNEELSQVEQTLRSEFLGQDPVVEQEPLQKAEGLFSKSDYMIYEEPIMELEPEPLPEAEGLMGKYDYMIGEEPIMELEPEPLPEAEGLMGKYDYMIGEEPIMELEPEPLPEAEGLMGKYDYMIGEEPIMELEPEPLPEAEGLMGKLDYMIGEEPIMELEPEMREESFLNQPYIPDAGMIEEEQLYPNLILNEETNVGLEPGVQHDFTEEDSDEMMMEEPKEGLLRDEEPSQEDGPVFDVEPQRRALSATEDSGPRQDQRGVRSCIGVVLGEKCYQFFTEPKRAADAEFFCQEHFPGGHLASITSQHVHRELMNMMLLQLNGQYTRTWVGGLRYLDTGRFIWLDGSHWGYADWLLGEPNNTANVEECLEVLPQGDGKFNDFTCWEPQAFICSYPYI